MKSFLTVLTFLTLLASVGCGKKTQEENKAKNAVEPTTGELNFYAFQELNKAFEANDLATIKKVVRNNPDFDLDMIHHDGKTFLIKAIQNDFIEIRNYLIEQRCNINKAGVREKNTPLITAVKNNRENSVQLLLALNAKTDPKDVNGDTALHLAIKNELEDIAITLINHGARLDITDKSDRNAYRLAQDFKLNRAVSLIRGLMQVEYGAPDISNFRNILTQGDYTTLKTIVDRYPRIANDYETINPLAILVNIKNENEGIKSAELLLKNNANVNGPVDAEVTPLIVATKSQKINFAILFLARDANPQLLDKDGKSALIHAIEINNYELVDMLLNRSAVEKYTFRNKENKKITYSACKVARATAKDLSGEAKEINKEIQDRLDCGLFGWLF